VSKVFSITGVEEYFGLQKIYRNKKELYNKPTRSCRAGGVGFSENCVLG
jgi:hypothetical protein